MAKVVFTVNHHFAADPQAVWDELADWAGHANWIPATRVEVAPGDPLAVGAEFTAWTGYGPLKLEDR
ncbi:MAG: SRPBCC family protein, partial [Acidimicrobiaceae bacterium]|nr:SRPBCC family protein [Acidimicrobiaceae bacterium]